MAEASVAGVKHQRQAQDKRWEGGAGSGVAVTPDACHYIAHAIINFHLPKGENEAKRKAANLCLFVPLWPREVSCDPFT